MMRSAEELRQLSELLDQALDLPPSERLTWLEGLQGDAALLGPTLRAMLERAARRETADLLERGPMFTNFSPDATHPGFAVGDTVGPYRLLRELGRGGMGEVWLADRMDGQLRRSVALKLPMLGVPNGMLAQRFARERDILATLEHPHIARLYDAGVDVGGRPYMALEYVEGKPLDVYAREQDLSLSRCVSLLLQVASALSYAHARLVLHRDLKPGNILVTDAGEIRLLDFGIAKLMLDGRTETTALTQLGGQALTMNYASPEQVRGEALGTASDVYSLGVVAFELLAGERPYRLTRGTPAEIEEAITYQDLPVASSVASSPERRRLLRGDLDAILNKALKRSVAERYGTVEALASDFRRYLEGEQVTARPDTLRYRGTRFVGRHGRALGATGLVASALALAIGLGATAVVIGALALTLASALFHARRSARERDRSLALAERNAAVNVFVETLLTRTARAGPLTAVQMLERSERLIEKQLGDNPEHRAYVLGVLATCHHRMTNPARSVELLQRAVGIASGTTDRALLDSLTSRLAYSRALVGDLKATALVDDLLARRDLAPEVRSEAHSHRSFMSHWLGDGSACLFHAREALRWLAASRQQSPIREVAVLGGLGNALMMQANGAEALSYFEQAAKLLTHSALADSPVAQQFAGTYAHALQEMGELRRSIAVAEKGLELEGRAQQEWLPSPYLKGYCGHALALMGRYDEALVVFEQSLASARELGLRGLVYTVRMLIAEMWIEQGLTQDGERESCQAEAEFGEAPEGASGQAARLRVRALLASSYGQVQASLALYEQYVGDDTLSAGAVDGWLGQSAARLRLGDLEAAEADVRRALEVSRQLQGRLPASFRTGHALLQLARVEAARHQNEAAARSASMALVHLLKMLHPQHPALTEAAAMLELHPQPPGGGVAAGNT